jgi:hypothetical protein
VKPSDKVCHSWQVFSILDIDYRFYKNGTEFKTVITGRSSKRVVKSL